MRKKSNMIQRGIALPRSLERKCLERAQKLGWTFSQWVREVLREEVLKLPPPF